MDRGDARLSPASFGALFEITARLIRRHPRVLLSLAGLFVLAPSLLAGAAGLAVFNALLPFLPTTPGAAPITPDPQLMRPLIDAVLVTLAVAVVSSVFAAVAAVSFSAVVAADYRSDRPEFRSAVGLAIRRAPAAVGAMLLSLLATLGLIAGAIAIFAVIVQLTGGEIGGGGPGVFVGLVAAVAFAAAILILSVRWSLSLAAVALEGAGPLRALVRSWRLTRGAGWRTLGILALASLAAAVLGGLVSELLGITLADLVFGDRTDQALVVRTIISALVSVAFAPLVPVALTVLYFDQRVRTEGFALSPKT